MLFSRLAVAMCAVVLTVPAWSGTLVLYPFTSDTSPTNVAPGITSILGTSTLASSIVADDNFGVVFQAYGPNGNASAAAALANNLYFTLTLSITPGTFTTLAFNFDVGKGGNSDSRGYFVRSSLDSFATDILSATLPAGSQQAPLPASFSVNAPGQTSVAFRFYVWAPTDQNSVDFRNLEVGDGIPEPGTWALAATGLAAALLRRRRLTQRDTQLA